MVPSCQYVNKYRLNFSWSNLWPIMYSPRDRTNVWSNLQFKPSTKHTMQIQTPFNTFCVFFFYLPVWILKLASGSSSYIHTTFIYETRFFPGSKWGKGRTSPPDLLNLDLFLKWKYILSRCMMPHLHAPRILNLYNRKKWFGTKTC